MNEQCVRLNLNIIDGLHPRLFKWLISTPPKLRCAKLSQYMELSLIMEENGGAQRRMDMQALPHQPTALPAQTATVARARELAGVAIVDVGLTSDQAAELAAASMGDRYG